MENKPMTVLLIEDDEIYDDFIAFLNDLYDLLGIGD